MRIKNVPALVKAGPDNGLAEGEFIVYPSTFTREPDAYGDIVKKGAFARGIEQRKTAGIQLPGLFGHRMDDPDYFVAYAIEESEDDHGWRIHGAFDMESPKAASTYRLAKAGRLREMSFAFDTLDEGQVTLDNGIKANELRDLDTFEFSFVPIGANRDTSIVAVKALAAAVVAEVKSGRKVTSEDEEALIAAAEQITSAAASIQDILRAERQEEEDDGTASGDGEATDETPEGKSKELTGAPSALTRLKIALAYSEGSDL